MKQAMKTTRMITMGLFTLCTMGFSQATFCGSKTDDTIEFRFIGKSKTILYFSLTLNNREVEEYIRMKDEKLR